MKKSNLYFCLFFCLFFSFKGMAQQLVVDSGFRPFFKITNSGGNPASLSDVWENPRTGTIVMVGDFSIVTPNKVFKGVFSSKRDGNINPNFVGGIGMAQGVSKIRSINDSILIISRSGNYGAMDTTGKLPNGGWQNWDNTMEKTVSCATGSSPFFFANGSSLMVNRAPGNPGGPGNGCRIVNPPDTFPHRFIIKVDSLGYWDSSFVPDAKGSPDGFAPYDSNRIWVYGNPFSFTHYDGVRVDGLCRIYHDGRLDTTFKNPILRVIINYTFPVGIPEFTEADGGFFMRGFFALGSDSSNARRLARFHADGSLDTTFAFAKPEVTNNVNVTAAVTSLVPTSDSLDQGYLVVGNFNQYQGHPTSNLVKVDSVGKLVSNYYNGKGADSTTLITAPELPGRIHRIIASKFGGYYVVGDWRYWDGKPSQPIVRLKEVNPVGLQEQEKVAAALEVNIYPNPAKEELLIETENKLTIQQIELYDLSGRRQQIWGGKSGENKYRLSLENLQTGLYFIVLKFKNGERLTKKIVKQ